MSDINIFILESICMMYPFLSLDFKLLCILGFNIYLLLAAYSRVLIFFQYHNLCLLFVVVYLTYCNDDIFRFKSTFYVPFYLCHLFLSVFFCLYCFVFSLLASCVSRRKAVLNVSFTSLRFPPLWDLDHSRPHCLGRSLTSSQKGF